MAAGYSMFGELYQMEHSRFRVLHNFALSYSFWDCRSKFLSRTLYLTPQSSLGLLSFAFTLHFFGHWHRLFFRHVENFILVIINFVFAFGPWCWSYVLITTIATKIWYFCWICGDFSGNE
jgi:hypothetical protein